MYLDNVSIVYQQIINSFFAIYSLPREHELMGATRLQPFETGCILNIQRKEVRSFEASKEE